MTIDWKPTGTCFVGWDWLNNVLWIDGKIISQRLWFDPVKVLNSLFGWKPIKRLKAMKIFKRTLNQFKIKLMLLYGFKYHENKSLN